MIYPVNGIGVGTPYDKNGHRGVDFGYNTSYGYGPNQPVFAIEDGTIIDIQKQKTGGIVVHLKLDQRHLVAEYGHLKAGSVKYKVGTHVRMGTKIAEMGNTGICSGNHLHLGLYAGDTINYGVNKWVNPFDYLCAFSNQYIFPGTFKAGYVKYFSKKVAAQGGLWCRKAPSILGKKAFILKNGQEVESFGLKNGWNIIDKTLGLYCSNKYLK
jgi:murein DD-endopeptidase MepM/ murein hydrolase activator NlpD